MFDISKCNIFLSLLKKYIVKAVLKCNIFIIDNGVAKAVDNFTLLTIY